MSAGITRVLHSGGSAWTYELSGTAPYTILFQGQVLESAWPSDSYTISMIGYDNEPPALEVLDSTESLPSPVQQNPGFLTLQWRGRSDAFIYQPDYKVGIEWEMLPPVYESGRGYYTYTTPWLAARSHGAGGIEQFRVKIIDELGNEGGLIPFTIFVLRHPDPPEVVVTWNKALSRIEVNSV